MCVLQVILRGRNHPDSRKDKFAYKQGDVLAVHEDSAIKEPPSPTGHTGFIYIPGVPASDLQYLVDCEKEKEGLEFNGKKVKKTKRREHRLNFNQLPGDLPNSKEVTATVAQVEAARKDV